MDRRAAGALLALAACIASSVAAPTASDHTALDVYEGGSEGCYYNFQHYGEGHRIMTNEPCLNCTCHNRMLMCYLRVCPFTKAFGQDCTVEKRADQCCPIVTCPDVPVDLLTSTSTTSPAEYGATGLGKLDKYGCSINGKYFPEGSKVPPTPNKPCEHCYCIRNMTTCVMQECTLHVDGCTPIYHKDVCCPIRYSCDHPQDEVLLLDDMSTTVRPTPGFLLTTTTVSPVTQMSQDCVHNDQIIADGASITTEKACEHCYCMKGDIVCVVQECGAPMENEGKNCTSLPPREGQCCPDTYICEGDDISTEIPYTSSTDELLEKITTLLPPRKSGLEGSGYRNEPNEAAYTEMPYVEPELEGSGEEGLDATKPPERQESSSGKPFENEEITTYGEDVDQYIPVTTKAPVYKESETSTKEVEEETIEPQKYSTSGVPKEDIVDTNIGVTQKVNLPHESVTTSASLPEKYDQYTTESIDSLNTVPDISHEKEHRDHTSITTDIPPLDETNPVIPQENKETESATSTSDQDLILNPISEITSKPDSTPNSEISERIDTSTTERSVVTSEPDTQKENSGTENDLGGISEASITERTYTISPEQQVTDAVKDIIKYTESNKSEHYNPSTTNTPMTEIEKLTTELNVEQNTVIAVEKDSHYQHITETTEKAAASDFESTEKAIIDNVSKPEEHISTDSSVLRESESTIEPDKGLNTIPSEIDEESNTQHSLVELTVSPVEIATTKSPNLVDRTPAQEVEASSVPSEASTLLSESHITKSDHYTVTTEPSFRKEDEIIISTEKPKEDFGSTTIKTEFVDEGLIPTSIRDEKLSTNTDIPSTYEEMTTAEYNKELEESTSPKQDTTSPSILQTSATAEPLGEKVTATNELDITSLSSTEKSPDATSLMPVEDTHEEPSRIPGEGDCLLNGVTYRNNTPVPNTNNCHTGCKCVSSIIKCDPIICSPPPEYMNNCQSIYDTPDSCCPTYICDHPRETIPPQSDNQMSGTEAPIITPTIECRGDQCELSIPSKPTTPSESCSSDNCVSAPGDKSEPVSSECGPTGCDNVVKEPVEPSVEQPQCANGKCETSAENCANGKCQLLPTDSKLPSVKPCDGDDCRIADEKSQIPQLCENEESCKKIEVPISEPASNANCGSGPCDPNVISPPYANQPELCKENESCKPEDGTTFDCTGDKPCRRKDSSVAEMLPPKCEGDNCAQKIGTSIEQDISQPNTVSPSLETITETMVSVKDEKVSPTTDEQKSEQEQIETTTATQFVTEEQHVPTEFMVSKIDTETKPVSITEATIEDQKEVLTEPTLIEKVPTKIANDLDNYTETSISIGEVSTQSPKEIQNTEENQATHTPEVVKAGHTVKPPSGEQEDITVPIENDREQTDKQKPTDTEVTKTFDEFTHKPSDVFTLSEESISEISDVTRDYTYTSTQTVDFASDDKELTTVDTKKPDIIEQHKDEPIPVTKEVDYVTPNTDKPQLNLEKETELPSIFEKEAEHKITTVQEESTNIPSITETHLTEIPDVINEHTDKVIVTENHTDEPITVTEKETKTSDGLGSDFTDKPSITEEQSTKLPDITEKQHTDSPTSSEEESTKIPKATEKYYEPTHVLEDHNEEVPTINDFATKAPHVTEEQSYVPVYVTEKGTDSPSYAIDHSDKPTLSKEQDMKIPHIDEIEPDDKLIPVKEKSTKSPLIIEDTTEDSVTVPGIMKEQTDESTEIPEAGTETASVIDEYTNKPAVITENIIKSPQYDGKESYQTSSPEETEEPNDKKTPILFEEELPGKTDDMKEITEKKPDFNENEIVTEPMISEESGTESLKVGTTKKPVLIDETAPDEFEVSTEDSLIITEKPSTEKLNLPNDEVVGEVTEGPSPVKVDEVSTSSETEHTYKPEIFELHTNAPEPKTTEPQGHSHQTPDEEQSSTIAPGTFQTETKLPESETEVSTKTTDMKLEKVTEIPVHELQTTEGEEHVNTGPELITNSMITPEVISKSPSTSDSSVIVPQDSGSNLTNADNMETVTKQQETTDVLSTVTISYDTLPPLREEDQMIYQPSKDITPTQEPVTSKKEADEKPDITVTTELVEKVTKPTEYESDHEEKAGSTGIPEQEPKPSSTKSPTGVAIEPQEGEEPQLPDVVKAGPTDEQTSTKPLEDEDIKSSTPDSHVPGITVGTEYGHTTIIAETDSVTEVVERETPNIRLPETHDNDLLHISTNSPITTVTEDVKTDSPDVYIPQKEAMTTSITESTNTVAPTKGFTETEGVSITDEEHPSNVFTENTTDHLEVSTTAQNDISSETLPSISKTTNGPEQSYTDFYLEHTEILVQRESESTEAYEKSTTFKSSEVSQKTSNTDELVSEQPHRRTETIEQENTTPLTSEIQHSSITSTPTETTDNVAILEDKTTKTPESYPQIHSDVNTKVPEIYGTSEPSATESSEPQEPTSEATEGLKTTGSFYSESHMTDDQKTEPLDTENATILPVSPVKSDSETLRPETDVHKSSTEVPAMFTEILTEMSHTEITTSAPLSMVTEHQPDDSVTNEKHDDTKTTPQEIETATQQETTERENDATLLHEITTDKQKEITKLVDKTTAGSEYSETTPYLIELEEHTHKIIDDISTISPVDEKESTYNPDDVLSTTSTSQEHHVDEHNITPSPTEEEHTVKIEDHLSTASTSDEYLTHKDLEDTSPASQSAGDMTTATELHDLEKVTAKIPEEKLEIITKQPEIPSSSSEEPSTGLGAPDETLTESIETDLETKPARDQTTQVPTISEDNEVDKKDLTTSKPSQDLEVTVPAIVMDTEKSPIVESDGDVPSTSASSDKNTASIDESIFSTTKPTTVKQEELLTPSSEDKYSQPEEKPSSESFSPTSTAEVPKPPVDIEPTEEIPTPEDDGLSSGMTGYGEPDYAEEDQAFGPGTCRYGGKVYVSAQQIPRDDPCDFCFCFRSDIICLQQSCPPPIHGCHEEPIQGFCCPRYECPVSMATTVNVTTTTTTTTTTLPPHFPTHGYRGAAQRRGCQIKGHSYKVGEVVRSSSGPCLHCTCGGDGQMKCDPKACTPEPMLRQMIAAAVSAKRRR